jgi:hypothetical protein
LVRELPIFLECRFTLSIVLSSALPWLIRDCGVPIGEAGERGVVNSSYVGILGEVGEAKLLEGDERRGWRWA